MKNIRPVHRSVWVRSVPNSKSTRLLRVYHFWTCCRPVKGVYSDSRTSSETGQFSVEVEICKTTPDFAKIHRICTKSGRICWDMAGFWWDLARSRRSSQTWRDLSGSHRYQAISRLIGLKPPVKRSHRQKTTTFFGDNMVGLIFSVFYDQTRQLIRWSRVLGAATRR